MTKQTKENHNEKRGWYKMNQEITIKFSQIVRANSKKDAIERFDDIKRGVLVSMRIVSDECEADGKIKSIKNKKALFCEN